MADSVTGRPKVPAAGASREEWDRYSVGCAELDVKWCRDRLAELDQDIAHHREMLKRYEAMRKETVGELKKSEAWLEKVRGEALTANPSAERGMESGQDTRAPSGLAQVA